jgi:hypothetical protein
VIRRDQLAGLDSRRRPSLLLSRHDGSVLRNSESDSNKLLDIMYYRTKIEG